MSDDQGELYCPNCGRAGRHCASCDDQDTTAPGRVNVTIKRVEVVADDPDRFVHSLNRAVTRELAAPVASAMVWPRDDGRWVRVLSMNLSWAGVEEMRVRAAVVRAVQVPHCLHCGGLLARPCGCETPGCRPGMAQTSICSSCNSPVPDGLYPCPTCDYRPWDGAVILTSGGRRQ